MNDQAVRVVMYEDLLRILREWKVGGRAAEFGQTSKGVVQSEMKFDEFRLLAYPEYDICNLHNLDTDWDFILADQVLEHVKNPSRAVEEVRKHLKPGGVAAFTTPFLYRLHGAPSDYWRFTPEGMRILCAGFQDVRVGQWGNREMVVQSFDRDPGVDELGDRRNDAELPIVVWTVARKAGPAVADAKPKAAAAAKPHDASAGGAWRAEDYAASGGDSWVEKRVCDYLVTTYPLKTALDLGCGAGLFVQYLNRRGLPTWGVEGEDLRASFPVPEKLVRHDLTTPLDLQKQFDLVLCLEVIEHLDARFETTLLETIARHAGRYLLFSGATPGQGGVGHVNEKPEAYWFSRLRDLGFRLLVDQTNICRALCKHSWYAKNISFWEKGPREREETPAQEGAFASVVDGADSYVANIEELHRRDRAELENQINAWRREAERQAAEAAALRARLGSQPAKGAAEAPRGGLLARLVSELRRIWT